MARPGADERLRRILAVIPWVVAADGPYLSEVCTRFGYRSEQELQEDLNLLFVCGVPPYTPDALIEVDVADGRVWIRYADWFARPLRLTPAEALSLVAASTALLGGEDSESVLARGLAKLAAALGLGEETVDVELAPEDDTLRTVRQASRDHHQVEIDYYAFGRDATTTRVIDPELVFSASGQWYVAGYCHAANADRLFRADRVRAVRVLEATFQPRPRQADDTPVFAPSPSDPSITLELEPPAAWAATRYPVEDSVDLGSERHRVTLRVSGEAWLARLLLRLGPDAQVVDGDSAAAARAARRLLDRYRRGQPVPSEDR